MKRYDFWDGIAKQIKELQAAKSADDVIRILGGRNDDVAPNADAFFAGGGGDETVLEALRAAGWETVWARAWYYFAMRAPDGSGITYIEGDVFAEIQQPLPAGDGS